MALKKLKSEEDFISFQKEGNMLASLSHVHFCIKNFLKYQPHIVQFLGTYIAETGEKYIVTEFLEKGSLYHFLLRRDTSVSNVDLLQMYD